MNNKLMLRDEEEPPGTKGSSNSSSGSEDSGEVPLAHDRHSVRPSRRINRQESGRRVSPSISNKAETSLEVDAVKASRAFRKRMFPAATSRDWNDWTWHIAHRITTLEQLETMLDLSDDERAALASHGTALPMAITPYYASLLDPGNPNQAIRRSMVPTILERTFSGGEDEDPLAEEHDTPVPGLVHRYPDRVLFLATDNCSAYCRYCTRSRMVGQRGVVLNRPMGACARLYRGASGNPRRPGLRRRPAHPPGRSPRLAARANSRNPARRIHPDRDESSRRAAHAHNTQPRSDASEASPGVDQHPRNAPCGADS